MNKIFKKVIAVAGTAAFGVVSLAGCTTGAKKATSMFDVVNKASQLEKYTYEVTASARSSGENAKFKLYGECDGKAVSMSFDVSMGLLKYDVEDMLIITEDTIYVNVKETGDFLSSLAEESGETFSLSDYGITGDWISIEYESNVDISKPDYGDMYDDLDKAYEDFIEEEDGRYIIEIKSDDDLREIIDATADLIDDKSEQWSEKMEEAYASINFVDVVSTVLTDLLTEINDLVDAGFTTEEIEMMVYSAIDAADISDLEVTASDFEEMFDELVDVLDEASAEAELDGGRLTIETWQEKNTYNLEASVKVYSDDEKSEVKCSVAVTSDKSVKVEIPSKNVQTLAEAVSGLLKAFGITSGQLESIMEDMADEIFDMFGSSDYGNNVGSAVYYDIYD
ncbi:MAG: hypothetical protein ACI4EN_03405 [Butyrivibrio sp.]